MAEDRHAVLPNVTGSPPRGCVSAEAMDTLKSRVISTIMSAKYQELQEAAQSPVYLFSTKRTCAEFNSDMLSKLQAKPPELCCADVVNETVASTNRPKKLPVH